VNDTAPKFPKFQAPVRRARTSNKFIGSTVDMLRSANPDCQTCFGTGWANDWPERCLVRCTCTDPAEVVCGS